MAKRTAQSKKKLFNLDLDTLFSFDMSQEEQNDTETFSTESNVKPKKFKSKMSTSSKSEELIKSDLSRKSNNEEDNETDTISDVSKFFENVGNDFSKSMLVKKTRLNRFTEAVISTYQSKVVDLVKKQDEEVEEFIQQGVKNIEKELEKFEEEFKKMKQQENKLMRILEQQMKMLQKSSNAQEQWLEGFAKLHQNFLQEYSNIKNKHKNETLDLKKNINSDISDLQNKFLTEFKKEEMQTMKKYLTRVYF